MTLNEFRTQEIVWDKANNRVFESVTASSGDSNGRKLRVKVVNKGVVQSLIGVSMALAWETPNKKNKGLDSFSTIDATKGIYEIAYTTGMLSNSGKLTASFVLTMPDGVIESDPFTIQVKKSVVDEGSAQSSNSFTALVDALTKVQGMDAVRGEVEAAKVSSDGFSHANLKDRLDAEQQSVNAQLAQKADESVTFANARNRLKIINYLENIDNIHPKVLYFEEGWNEWKYWMAYTPYPGGYTENENPSIAVSQDGINWTTPDGLVNPVEPKPDNGYNSDTHLVMNNGTMELWWRSVFASDTIIYRRTSNDGVNWSNREEVLNSVSYGGDILSPAIIVENGRYKMWGCRSGQVVYNESNDGSSWNKENEMTLNINWGNLTAWHMDVVLTDEGYELLVQAYPPGGGNNFSNLYYVKSQDNASFSEPIMVMKPSTGGSWDNQGIYRASFVKISGTYHVFYSAVSSNNRRAISLSVGEELSALKGYENTGTFDMSAYSIDDERGLRLSKPVVLPSGFQERGAYIQTSSLPNTAKIAGAGRGREYVGGLEVSNLYIVDKEESASLPLDIVRGTVRRDEMDLEMYDGNAWKKINDSRKNLFITGAQDINGMDLNGVRSIIFTGTGTVTITGFSGGSTFKETDLYIDSSTITVIIKDGSGVVNPDREDFVLNQSKVNCRVMRVASTRWRIYE